VIMISLYGNGGLIWGDLILEWCGTCDFHGALKDWVVALDWAQGTRKALTGDGGIAWVSRKERRALDNEEGEVGGLEANCCFCCCTGLSKHLVFGLLIDWLPFFFGS